MVVLQFAQTQQQLHSNNPALASNANFSKLVSSADAQVYAFTRTAGKSKVLVVVNLSGKAVDAAIADAAIAGDASELFTDKKAGIKAGQTFNLPAWGYQVYTYQKKVKSEEREEGIRFSAQF